jgi:segregation and condensation protein B
MQLSSTLFHIGLFDACNGRYSIGAWTIWQAETEAKMRPDSWRFPRSNASGQVRGPGLSSLANSPLERLQNRRLPAVYRVLEGDDHGLAPRGELVRDGKLACVEAALFAADEPLTLRRLAEVAGLADAAEARQLVRKLHDFYERGHSSFNVEELAGGFQLFSRPEFHTWLARLRHTQNDLRLSPAARETLAIVAYRQPIMRADIEAIRGVQCGEILRLLMEKGLVRIAGRHDSLGRPVLYGTTKKFMQAFGLRSLSDLPEAEQLRQP